MFLIEVKESGCQMQPFSDAQIGVSVNVYYLKWRGQAMRLDEHLPEIKYAVVTFYYAPMYSGGS
jgi:hypothetical protein